MGDTSEASLPPNARLSRFSECLLFSDFLEPVAELRARFEAIAAQGVRGHLIDIVDPAEETLPYAGRTEFAASEGRDRMIAGRAETLREDYQERLGVIATISLEVTRRLGWSFLIHHTDRPPEEAVLSLHSRLAGLDSDYRYRPPGKERATAGPRASSHDHHRRDRFLQPWVLAALAALPQSGGCFGSPRQARSSWSFRRRACSRISRRPRRTPAQSPWWLTALRMLLAALIILALARPVLNPDRRELRRHGPPPRRHRQWLGFGRALVRAPRGIEAAIDRAARDGRTIVLAPSAPGQPVSAPLSPR